MNTNVLTWAKRVLPALALTMGLLVACKPEPETTEPTPDEPIVVPEPEPNPYDGPMDSIKVLTYTRKNIDSLEYRNVMKYANNPRVTKIIYFLDSTNFNNDFRNRSDKDMHNTRNIMEERINYAPSKAVGAGTYVIYPGRIYPDDSIWFINHGWKIKSSENYRGK